jgi:hypothetical protein
MKLVIPPDQRILLGIIIILMASIGFIRPETAYFYFMYYAFFSSFLFCGALNGKILHTKIIASVLAFLLIAVAVVKIFLGLDFNGYGITVLHVVSMYFYCHQYSII